MDDPIIAEVRKHRDEHARRFGYDLDAICADLVQLQNHGNRRIVDRRTQSSTIRCTRPASANASASG